MEAIDKYLKEKTSNITFIELKEKLFIELKDYTINEHIPLPIITSKLIAGIKDGGYEEEI